MLKHRSVDCVNDQQATGHAVASRAGRDRGLGQCLAQAGSHAAGPKGFVVRYLEILEFNRYVRYGISQIFHFDSQGATGRGGSTGKECHNRSCRSATN